MVQTTTRRVRRTLVGAGCVAATLLAASPAAAETGERFLEQLRSRGHGDLALEYLERVDDDPLASPDFRRRARFERLSLRADRVAAEPDPARRAAALDELAAEVDAAAPQTVPGRRAVTDARGKLALADADSARRGALAALRDGSPGELAAAREALTAARRRVAAAADAFVAERETLKGVAPDSPDGQRRRDLGGRLGQARLIDGRLLHELAMTHPAGSDRRERLNREAAELLAAHYEKYSKWVVGLYAHLYEGRCYRFLGETALALACFEDLARQPASTPELRRVVTLAHAETAALRVGEGEPAKALDGPADWLDDLPRRDRSTAAAATLAYWVGEAMLAQAETGSDDDRRRLLARAEELLAEAARVPTEVQPEARAAWVRLSTAQGTDAADFDRFEDAYQAGKQALSTLAATRLAAGDAADPELTNQAAATRRRAREAFDAALRLAGEKTDAAELNESRYLLAWLLWEDGDDLEAAKLAGGVATRSPDDPSAQPAAQLALAAMQRIAQSPGDERLRTAAEDRMRQLAGFTAERWPDSAAGAAALQLLLNAALVAGDLDAARQVLDSVNDARRPALALQFELARWEQAKRGGAADTSAELDALRSAYEAAKRTDTPQQTLTTATLYLAQADLDAGDARRALALLDADGHGAAGAASSAAPAEPLRQQATIALVRAVAGAGPARRVPATLQTLDDVAGALDADDRRRLLLTLGARLRAGLAAGAAANRDVCVRVVGEALNRIDESIGAPDWNTALWSAQARLELAEATGDSPAARAELEAASRAFARLVEKAEADRGFAPSPTAALAARLQLAQCDRRLGKRREALDAFRALLAARPAMLDVQVAAAETLQEWGVESGNGGRIEASIAGDYPDDAGKNTVWGWAKIAAVAGRSLASNPKLEETFFNAWLNVARSRYLAGTLVTGPKRDAQFRKAAGTIKALRRQHPELGGEALAAEFDALLRRIEPGGRGG